MTNVTGILSAAFDVLSLEVLNIPFYGWAIIIGLFSMIGLFLRGKK